MAHDLFHTFCKHYPHGGLMEHEKCGKDVAFEALTVNKLKLPCFNPGMGVCLLAEYPNAMELTKIQQEIKERLVAMVKFMRRETTDCIHCGKPVKKLRQRDHSVYGDCGCRMWQGRIPVDWRPA